MTTIVQVTLPDPPARRRGRERVNNLGDRRVHENRAERSAPHEPTTFDLNHRRRRALAAIDNAPFR